MQKPYFTHQDQPAVLCLDDEAAVLDSLRRTLQPYFKVITTGDADEATQTLQDTSVDVHVVICDYSMPKLRGTDFLTRIRDQHPDVARILLTGQIELDAVAAALNAGLVHKLILKPWDNDFLVCQVHEGVLLHNVLRSRSHFHHLSITDAVTGLPNHRHFQEKIREVIDVGVRDCSPLSLAMFDVDYFKSFNDQFGHLVGDRMLNAIARKLRESMPDTAFVARYGGEEFVAIFPAETSQRAFEFVENARQAVEKDSFMGILSKAAFVTVSAGVSQWDGPTMSASKLVERADQALYQAKRQGRNQTVIAKP